MNNILKRLEVQTLAQASASDAIANNFTSGLKSKIVAFGAAALFGVMSLTASNLAVAGDNSNLITGVLGMTGITGILLDGNKPTDLSLDCANVRGINGYQVAGATAAGGALGGFVNSKNRTAVSILGAGIAGGAVYYKEKNRIEQECAAAIQRANSERERQNSYSNSNVMYGANNVPQMPTEPILYVQKNPNGSLNYVTISNNSAIQALNGYKNGTRNIDSDSVVKNALEQSYSNFQRSYSDLDKAAQASLDLTNGKDSSVKSARYSLEPVKAGATIQAKSRQLAETIDAKFNTYAEQRAVFFKIGNEAVTDGYDISKFRQGLDFVDVPQSLRQVYYNNGTTLNNRYPSNILN